MAAMTSRRQRFLRLESFVLTIVFLLCMSAPVYASSHDLPIEYLWNKYDYMKPQQLLYNALPHEYLAGYYSEDGSEITITGMKVIDVDSGTPFYVYRKDIVIPDEIEGVPVTTIAESAFEYYSGNHSSEIENAELLLTVGKNVVHVEPSAFCYMNIAVGKNVFDDDFDDFENVYGAFTYACYPDSAIHRAMQTPPFSLFYDYQDYPGHFLGHYYSLIDESRLISDTVEIDAYGNVRLPLGVTKETLENYVSVDGDATIRVVGDTIETGTQIELVNSTYGTIDNTYTVMLADAQIAITAKSQHIAYTGTAIPFVTAVQTTGSPYTLSYTSDNPDVATVDEDGKIHAQKAGTATVTVTAVCENGATQSADCAVTVVDRAYLTSTERIDTVNQIVYLPYGATKETLENIVTLHGDATMVLSDEKVTTGTQIKLVNNTFGTTDMVYTVKREEPKITVTAEEEHIAYVGETFRLNSTVQTNGSPCRFSYSVSYSGNAYVTVDENGNFTTKNPGTTYIYVSAKDKVGFYDSASCRLIVIPRAKLISDTVEIDKGLNVHIPYGMTKQDLEDCVSVDGDATLRVVGDSIVNGTQIELVNNTYGTIDNTYTIVMDAPEMSLSVAPQHTAYAETTFHLDATVQTSGKPCTLTYTSDNPDVAAVDANGSVTTKQSGTATVTVTATDECGFTQSAVCTVTVIDRAHLVSDTVEIDESGNVHLPFGVTKETLGTYVSVDGNATIRVVGGTIADGTQIELVNNTYGTIDNTYTVVLEAPQITLRTEPQYTVYAKTSFHLDAAVQTNGTPCTLTYTSDNPDVAAVDANGSVTTNKSGTATVTVTATDECGFTQSAVCTITVKYTWWQWLLRIFLFGWLWY